MFATFGALVNCSCQTKLYVTAFIEISFLDHLKRVLLIGSLFSLAFVQCGFRVANVSHLLGALK